MKKKFTSTVLYIMLIAIILAGSCMPVLSAAADGTSAGNTVDVGIKRVYDKTTETYDESPLVPAGASGSGNSWQIVEGKYNGYGTSQKISFDENGNQVSNDSSSAVLRVQKNVVPTENENEFLVYMSVDAKELLSSYYMEFGYGATTSNSDHANELGDLVSTMEGNMKVDVSDQPIYKNYANFTIYDIYGNLLFDNKPLYWSQGNNGTLFVKLDDNQYILLGISVKAGTTAKALTLTERATEAFYDAVAKMQNMSVTDVMGKADGSGTSLGENIEFIEFVAGDYDESTTYYDPATNSIHWVPIFNFACDRDVTTTTSGKTTTTTTWYLNAYQLVYKVRLTTESKGFNSSAANMDSTKGEKESYEVNNSATLIETDSETHESKVVATFPDPYVRGLLYETPKITKQDDQGNPVKGAIFTLTRSEGIGGGDPISYTSDGSAQFSFPAVPEGTYTLKETTVPEGYTAAPNETFVFNYTDNPGNYKVGGTNTAAVLMKNGSPYTSETVVDTIDYSATTDVSAEKVWDDADDRDGKRPSSVTFRLFKTVDGTTSAVTGADQALDANSGWECEWTDLPVYENKKKVAYSVKELNPSSSPVADGGDYNSDYKASYNGFTITNSHTPENISFTVTKVWDDNDNQDGKRDSYTVQLYANGEACGDAVTLDKAILSYEWTDLPKYSGGKEIEYTIDETGVPKDYEKSISGSDHEYTITNKHTPEETSVAVTKVWEDEDDQDGIRSESVSVVLKADGTQVGDSVVLSDNNSWTTTWDELPVYAGGDKIEYTVDEAAVPEGYEKSISGSDNEYTITNKHTPEEISVTVTKVWEDEDDQDGIRTESISVVLMADGTQVGDSVVLSDNNSWTTTWDELPVYAGGDKIEYTVDEAAVPEGYEKSISGSNNEYTITNTHTPETTTFTVTKVWDDNSNQNGKRDDYTVQLYADGETYGTAVTLTADKLSYEWKDLPKFADGEEIEYTVDETGVPDGYEKTVDGSKITNKYTPETTSFIVTKVWDDNSDQDGKRDDYTVQLYADGEAYGTAVTLTANTLSYEWTDLPKYADGEEIEYTVDETGVPDGYEKTVDGNTITNKYTPETTTFTVTKVWDDNSDQDGKRDDYTVQLYADGEAYGTAVTLTANTLSYEWKDLPKYADGDEIEYTVDETGVPDGYEKTVDGSKITNKYSPETTTFTVTKVWDDNSNQDGKRDDYTVQLYADGEAYGTAVTLTADTLSYEWTDLPKFADGEEIEYTVEETGVPDGYEKTVDGSKITNKYTPETTTFTVTKVWDDNSNQDGKRDDYTVQLYADGEAYGTAVTLTADKLSYEWKDLPKYADGDEIEYTVDETGVPDGYEKTVDGSKITNKYTPETTSFIVTKVWDDNSDQDGKRDDYTVQLYADSDAYGTVVTLTADTLSYEWKDLPKFADGEEIEYTVDETGVPEGYEKTVDGNVITNSYTPETTSFTVTKVWDDNSDQDGKRNDYTVQLYADGEAYGTAVTLTADTLSYAWKNLPKYADGEEIEYTVDETGVPDGYEKTVDGNVITNSYTPETTSFTVTKVWDDKSDQDGKRDDYTVQLYADGVAYGTAVTLTADTLSYEWKDLPKFADGEEIEYSVDETGVPEGYEKTVDGNKITNKYTPETTSFTVTKVWDDNSDQDGKRDDYTVQLYADGEAYGTAVTLTADKLSYEWKDLPKYTDGEEIEYTVDETGVPDGYEKTVDGSKITNKYTPETTGITLTKVWDDNSDQDGKRFSVTFALYKTVDGVKTLVKDNISLTADNDTDKSTADIWTVEVEDLPVYEGGKTVTYTVEETSILNGTGYAKIENGLTVTNTRSTDTVDLIGSKIWNDADYVANKKDYVRPDIQINIYGKTASEASTSFVCSVTVTAADADSGDSSKWNFRKEGLPKYRGGEEITYSINETPLTGYKAAVINGFTVTNTPLDKTVDMSPVSVTIAKVDENVTDGNGISGAQFKLEKKNSAGGYDLIADDIITISGGTADIEFTSDGEYRLTETAAPDGYTLGDPAPVYTFTVVKTLKSIELNSLRTEWVWKYDLSAESSNLENGVLTVPDPPETTDLTITKVWDDDSNRDGKRFSVTFALYKSVNGTTSLVKDGISLTADNDTDKSTTDTWTVVMKELPSYEDGKAVTYTVKETSSLDGTGYAKTENGLTVTNTRSTDTVDITVNKIWDDADYVTNKKDYVRPDVVLSLYGQTVSENEPVFVCDLTLTEADADSSDSSKWSVTKTGFPMYRGGEEITYTITEETIPGYKAPVIDGLTATNTPLDRVDDLLPATSTLRKVDAKVKNSAGLSGAAFKLEKKDISGSWLLVTDNIVTGNDGTAVIEFATDGEYRLTETAAPAGYVLTSPAPAYNLTVERKLIGIELNDSKTAWVWKYDLTVQSDSMKDGILPIPNGADTATVTLTKVWKDNSNKKGKRFSGVTFDLYKTVNGVTTLAKEGIFLTAENDTDPETADIWTVDILNMPLYEDGYTVVYTVTETTPLEDTDYIKAEDGLIVTNTYVHSPVPPTGDDTNVACQIIITTFSLIGIGVSVFMMMRRRRKRII